MRQTLTIPDWHPSMNPNGNNSSRGAHWAVARKRHQVDRDTAWASARQAGWKFTAGRVRLNITFVYPRNVRVDADNLVARCKGVIDGLRNHGTWIGFFTDDATVFLDLHVDSRVERGVKAIEITLESTEADAA